MKIHPFKAAIGFLIVFLSAILLLTSSGYTPWSIWLFVWQFWPMLFVIFGAAFLMRRWHSSFFLGMPVFIVIFAIMTGGLWLTWKDQYFNTNNFAEENVKGLTETKISNELPKKIEKADVKIFFGAANIELGSMPDTESNFLYDGTHNSNFFTINQRLELVGSKAKLTLKSSPFVKKPFSSKSINELSLNFSQKPEYSFDVTGATSDIKMNLEGLKVSNLDIDAAASKVEVSLGKRANTKVKVKSGASSVKFHLPKDVAVRITTKSAITSNNFADFGLIKDKSDWESQNWDQAKNKIEIRIESGISKVELVQ